MLGRVVRFAVQTTACAFAITSDILWTLASDGSEIQEKVYRVLMTDGAVKGVLGTEDGVRACARQLARQSGKDVVVLETVEVVPALDAWEPTEVDQVPSQN